ncbi:MAG TPA: hypothetical protein VFF66_07650 [Brevundimonas sp.]|nr:hypothetical protein [Brevundimonas sp.]
MRSMIAAASVLILLGACAPQPGEPEPPVADIAQAPSTEPPSDETRATCQARGGEMQRVGLLGTWQCIIRYADAGKRCTDGDQCQGDCRSEVSLPPPPPGPPVVPKQSAPPPPAHEGVCQADSDPFGCFAVIEDGKAAPMLCVD